MCHPRKIKLMIIITNDKLVPNNHTIIIIIIIIIVIIIMITIVKVFKRQGTPPSKKKVFLWVLHDAPITPYAVFLKKKKALFFHAPSGNYWEMFIVFYSAP